MILRPQSTLELYWVANAFSLTDAGDQIPGHDVLGVDLYPLDKVWMQKELARRGGAQMKRAVSPNGKHFFWVYTARIGTRL